MSNCQTKKLFVPVAFDLPFSEAERAKKLNKFYTKAEVARQCIDDFELSTGIDLTNTNLDILEPSAGAGAFLDFLPNRTLAYDLQPEDPRIATQDFLQLERSQPAVVIGNPPFGKSCSLAIQFFNHAATFADHIGFIVPRTFEKASVQNRLNSQFHLAMQRVLTGNNFTFVGVSCSVPCIFQVWSRRQELRQRIFLPRVHSDFAFVNRNEADFAVQRVGANAGRIKTCFDNAAETSHYFLRANGSKVKLLSLFRRLNFSEIKARTAGNPSIAKTEIVAAYAAAKGGLVEERKSI